MRRDIITSTTNSIDGASVEKYVKLVSVNVVVGTNFFSDFGASFTDFFGGLSDTYQSKLEKIYKVGIDKIKIKAMNIGANAILGIKIDFDEISGKGKSMFMLSIMGTAVILKYKESNKEKPKILSDSIISNERLEEEVTKRLIIEKFSTDKLPSLNDWSYLLNSPIPEIADKLLNQYIIIDKVSNSELSKNENLILTNTPNYFKILDENHSVRVLYSNMEEYPIPILKLLVLDNLFSPSEIIKLINKEQVGLAIECLQASKNHYTNEDLLLMQEIISILDNDLEDLGKIEPVKNLLGKIKEKYICQRGHHNDVNNEYCSNYDCGINIKGLTRKEVSKIEQYRIKVDSLNSILNTDKQIKSSG